MLIKHDERCDGKEFPLMVLSLPGAGCFPAPQIEFSIRIPHVMRCLDDQKMAPSVLPPRAYQSVIPNPRWGKLGLVGL